MPIIEDRLRQTFSEGGAQEIYQEVKASGGFLGFARRYVFSEEPMEQREQSDACINSAESRQRKTEGQYRVARSALWGLTKASREELSQLQMILNEFIDQAMQTENSSVRRLSLNPNRSLDCFWAVSNGRH